MSKFYRKTFTMPGVYVAWGAGRAAHYKINLIAMSIYAGIAYGVWWML